MRIDSPIVARKVGLAAAPPLSTVQHVEPSVKAGGSAPQSTASLSVPNAITLAGYGATIGWLAGGPWPLAVVGLLADELDGRVARSLGESTAYGSLLDWAVDLTLTGLVLMKLGCPWLLLVVTPVQVYLREIGWTPSVGSARAAFTLLALARGGR